MNFKVTIGSTIVTTALLAALCGCQKPEGPAEQAGKKIDKAVDQVGQKIEETGDRLKNATQGEKK